MLMMIDSFVAEQCVVQDLTRKIQPASDQKYENSDEVLVYSNMKMKWFGPFDIVVLLEGRMITVQEEVEGIRYLFGAFQVKNVFKEYGSNVHYFKNNENDKGTTFHSFVSKSIKYMIRGEVSLHKH